MTPKLDVNMSEYPCPICDKMIEVEQNIDSTGRIKCPYCRCVFLLSEGIREKIKSGVNNGN